MFGTLLSLILTFFLLSFIDQLLNTVLSHYIDLEVEKVSTVIVTHAVKKIHSNNHFVTVEKEGNIIHDISYNTNDINQFNDLLVEEIQKEIYDIENGNFDDYSFAIQQKLKEKYPFFHGGYLCEVSLNSLRGSSLFGNLGPVIPIKLSFLGYLLPDIDIEIKEYGLNNVIVEVYSIVDVSTLITMPVSSKIHHTKVKNVLSFEIIQGQVPSYYVGR